jgi:spore germination cell wall hydrolase CwlJ-like protein
MIAAPALFYFCTDHLIVSNPPAATPFALSTSAPAHDLDARAAARMAAAARFEAMRQSWRPTNEVGCLAEAMYYEARGEGLDGQEAVAEVILQRTRDGNYPRTICGVVHQGVQPGRLDCQFSFACDGSIVKPKEAIAWDSTRLLAQRIVSGAAKLANRTGHAVAYHSATMTPAWAGTMEKTIQIGNHVFYRWSGQIQPDHTAPGDRVTQPADIRRPQTRS